ncbi:MAG: DUF4837 family protein [Bacteroidia bacterium]
MYKLLAFVVGISLIGACSSGSGSGTKSRTLAKSIGGEYEIVVIVDDEPKDAPHVQALTNALIKAYPMLNQPEPWFTLSWIDVDAANQLTQKNRNLIFLANRESFGKVRQMAREVFGDNAIEKMENDPEQYMIMGSDAWVKPQNVMYLAAENANVLANKIELDADRILKYFEEKEFTRIHKNLFEYNSRKDLTAQLESEMGVSLRIPEVYEPAVLDIENPFELNQELGIGGFKWFYSNSRNAFQNVAIWTMSYKDTSQLSAEGIITARDSILKYFIPCEDAGSYMGTETRWKDIYPKSEVVKLNGKYAVRTTGFWTAINGFQGGPFVNYVVVDEENERLVYIDGSVAAKGQPKKKFIIRLKAILSTLTIL